jgi:hypothetical protein
LQVAANPDTADVVHALLLGGAGCALTIVPLSALLGVTADTPVTWAQVGAMGKEEGVLRGAGRCHALPLLSVPGRLCRTLLANNAQLKQERPAVHQACGAHCCDQRCVSACRPAQQLRSGARQCWATGGRMGGCCWLLRMLRTCS